MLFEPPTNKSAILKVQLTYLKYVNKRLEHVIIRDGLTVDMCSVIKSVKNSSFE